MQKIAVKKRKGGVADRFAHIFQNKGSLNFLFVILLSYFIIEIFLLFNLRTDFHYEVNHTMRLLKAIAQKKF